ncbi:serine hydrolase domain-containing protein [Chachezhania sediminis]|uniref:serine hydrolase domain-containing protein n=1 Tax=Chachezhania sediminis TaxID=2599291 RepID=UPI00131E13F9|nr:serine hydrolase domain-containing protein [Chachezhania sediminis]
MRMTIPALLFATGLTGTPALAQTATSEQIRAIRTIAEDQIERHKLNSLLVEVRIGGDPVLTDAWGEAMTGVPATVDGRFRNGAVALAYVAALALRLAEDGVIDMDEPIGRWLPDLPGSDTATFRMLANMTAGYPDHVADDARFEDPFIADPFATWTPEDLIEVSLASPRLFAPGTNWDYSHSGYVILGQALEAAAGKPMHQLMDEYVLGPLDLTGTYGFDTAQIPAPAIHGFTAERGLWEDATYWNPSWTLPSGAIQVTTISDMARSFDTIVGHDGFLTADSYGQMIDPVLIGFGAPLEGCPSCHTLTEDFSYGLGAMLQGDWVFQTPLFGGYASAVGTLPEDRTDGPRITIAVAATYTRESVEDWETGLPNWANQTVRLIAAELHPENPPPMR